MALSCALYDELELSSMRGLAMRLTFQYEDGEVEVVLAKIQDLYVKAGKETLLTDNGQEFSLDYLIAIEQCKE